MLDDRYRALDRGQRAAELAQRERGLQNLTQFDAQQLPDPPSLPAQQEDGLSPRQRAAIGHLLAGQSVTATAAALGVTRQTIHNWKCDPRFALILAQKSSETLEAIATRARNILLRTARHLDRAASGELSFDQAVRLANSRRIWDMALLLPREESEMAEEDIPQTADDGAR